MQSSQSNGEDFRMGVLAGAAIAIIHFPIVMFQGATFVPSEEEVAKARASMAHGLEKQDLQGRLGRRFLEIARMEAGVQMRDLGFIDIQEQRRWETGTSLQGKRGGPCHVHLEILGLPSNFNMDFFGANRGYSMAMVARLRVYLPNSKEPVYDGRLVYHDLKESHPYPDWGKNEAQFLTDSMKRGVDLIAERFVEEVFLRYRPGPRHWGLFVHHAYD